jgi:hypothetical protein
VVYVRETEVDDQYNRVRDVSYAQSSVGAAPNVVTTTTKITQYTRVWEVFWTVYGPNSFDNARKIRSALFDRYVHDQFARNQLFLVTDPRAPVRAPEFHDGQWWERVDFSAKFNEFVTETYSVEMTESVEIIVVNEVDTEIADIILPEDVNV